MSGDDVRFTRRTLRYGSAGEAGLAAEHVRAVVPHAAAYLEPSSGHPLYAGAVVLAARRGVIVAHRAVGHALRYASYDQVHDRAVELPRAEWAPMREDTVFDLASVTKLFTAIAVVAQAEAGRLDLDRPVASYLPEFAEHGKRDVTARQLLAHTSGLSAWLPLYRDYDTPGERIQAVYGIEPAAGAGRAYEYSDLNLIMLGELVEKVTGRALDEVVRSHITAPLAMSSTTFNPPQALRERIAATEYQPWTARGMVRGSVHDENALGGVAGHAGLFSTAHDLAVLAQAILGGGRYGQARILSEDSVRALLTNVNAAFHRDEHGLGFELNQHWYMDAMASPVTAGHTGYTGTSLVIDPLSESFAILLSNRVHPTRAWGSNNPARRAVARDLALAVPAEPANGRTGWRTEG
ncbi:MAG: serine hydrolase domain-containing protein [Carbonactinosporaceae bacterium]